LIFGVHCIANIMNYFGKIIHVKRLSSSSSFLFVIRFTHLLIFASQLSLVCVFCVSVERSIALRTRKINKVDDEKVQGTTTNDLNFVARFLTRQKGIDSLVMESN